MSAADKREELEAALWKEMTTLWNYAARVLWNKTASAGYSLAQLIHDPQHLEVVRAILMAADRYAEAVADERIAGRVHERAVGRERLAEAVAAAFPKRRKRDR